MRFILSPDCKIVRGKERAAIYDLRRGGIYLVSNSFVDLFKDYTIVTDNVEPIAWQTIKYLVENQYLLEESSIPILNISENDTSYSFISNCIIEYNENFPFKKIASELRSLFCESIFFYLDERLRIGHLRDIDLFSEIMPDSEISIYAQFPSEMKMSEIEKVIANFSIALVVLYDSPIEMRSVVAETTIVYSNKTKSYFHCGGNESIDFKLILNNRFYSESKKFNNCLYKKLVIRNDGSLSNCPLSLERYGYVFDSLSFYEIITSERFQKYWGVTKDCVVGCNKCELRYACLDCRYSYERKFSYQKPIWCNYYEEKNNYTT